MSASLSGVTACGAVFGTGLLASLSPCVYPMLPITLGFLGTQAQDQGDSRRLQVLSYAAGQVLCFVGLGAFAVFAGESLGFASESPTVCIGTGLLMLFFGGFSLAGRLPRFLSRFGESFFFSPTRVGAFALGVGSVLVASPCTTPILSGVLALMASQVTLLRGLALMVCFALGFCSLLLLLGFGVLRREWMPRSGRWMVQLHRAGAIMLFASGGYFVLKGLR